MVPEQVWDWHYCAYRFHVLFCVLFLCPSFLLLFFLLWNSLWLNLNLWFLMRDILQMVILGMGRSWQILLGAPALGRFFSTHLLTPYLADSARPLWVLVFWIWVCALFVLVCLLSCSQVWLSLLVYDLTRLGYAGPSPITCLWLNTYLYLHHVCFILSDLKCHRRLYLKLYKSSLKCKGKGFRVWRLGFGSLIFWILGSLYFGGL
jgi:hypothetical protein